ncbi:unnamed protein product [Heterobilharzia americana]|nr:unnamed protein product [Heterobilharzia americana]
MVFDGSSFTMDAGLLAELSRELKDRICADAFQNLQKRTNRELFIVNCEVDRVLRNEAFIKSRLYPLIDIIQEDRRRSIKIRSIKWNKKEFLPTNQKTNKVVEKIRLNKQMGLECTHNKHLKFRKPRADVHFENLSAASRNDYFHKEDKEKYVSDMFVQSAPPRITSDELLRGRKTSSQFYTLRHSKSRTNNILLDGNKEHSSENVNNKPKEQENFKTQWRPESDPLNWKAIQFTTIDSEARSRSRNRLCGAFNATSCQLIYAH